MTLTTQGFKEYLLGTGYFLDNHYLKDYINLVLTPPELNPSDYAELHHAIQVSYYKLKHKCEDRAEALRFADADPFNFKVLLTYKNHCLAHYLLYFCTTGVLKAGNCNAVNFIVDMYSKLTTNGNKQRCDFNQADFQLLETYMNEIREDEESKWWTAAEFEFLKENYTTYGVSYCAEYLNRSYASTKYKARKLGLRVDINEWTTEEDDFLKVQYPTMGQRWCAEQLDRSMSSVSCRAGKLGIKVKKGCTEYEKQFIKQNFQTYGIDGCAQKLNIDKNLVAHYAYSQHLVTNNFYTEQEKQFIIENYAKIGARACAMQLGRTYEAIRAYATKTLKLKRLPQGDPLYCPELNTYYDSISAASRALNLSDGIICQVAQGSMENFHGLHFIKVNKEEYYNAKRNNERDYTYESGFTN